jgi:hypothetical protein
MDYIVIINKLWRKSFYFFIFKGLYRIHGKIRALYWNIHKHNGLYCNYKQNYKESHFTLLSLNNTFYFLFSPVQKVNSTYFVALQYPNVLRAVKPFFGWRVLFNEPSFFEMNYVHNQVQRTGPGTGVRGREHVLRSSNDLDHVFTMRLQRSANLDQDNGCE